MNYRVVKTFSDLQDNNYTYNAGDEFPRKGVEVSDERIKELSGPNNKLGTPLIKEIKPKGRTTKKKKVEEDAD